MFCITFYQNLYHFHLSEIFRFTNFYGVFFHLNHCKTLLLTINHDNSICFSEMWRKLFLPVSLLSRVNYWKEISLGWIFSGLGKKIYKSEHPSVLNLRNTSCLFIALRICSKRIYHGGRKGWCIVVDSINGIFMGSKDLGKSATPLIIKT